MAFHKAIPPGSTPVNTAAYPEPTRSASGPDLWAIFHTLRDARAAFGLKSAPLQLLSAMLSCLKPGKGLVVFASNRELMRRAGIANDRTLRRYIAQLEAAAVLRRNDSPNRKRYVIRDPDSPAQEAYGFDLAPFVAQAARYAEALETITREAQRKAFLRSALLARLARLEALAIATLDIAACRRLLRNRHSADDLAVLLAAAEALLPGPDTPETAADLLTPDDPSVAGGQSARHHSMSETEDNDSDGPDHDAQARHGQNLLRDLSAVCSEALAFAIAPIRHWQDMRAHGLRLAPMLGIESASLDAAKARLGADRVAMTVLLLMQIQPRVKNMQAYFRSITLGRRSEGFDPLRLLRQLEAAACR